MFVPKDIVFHTQFRNKKNKFFNTSSPKLWSRPLFSTIFQPSIPPNSTSLQQPKNTSPRTQQLRLLLPSNHISPAETNGTRNHSTDQIQRTQNARIPSLDRFVSPWGRKSSHRRSKGGDGCSVWWWEVLGVRDDFLRIIYGLYSWWLNQPIWKICLSNWMS